MIPRKIRVEHDVVKTLCRHGFYRRHPLYGRLHSVLGDDAQRASVFGDEHPAVRQECQRPGRRQACRNRLDCKACRGLARRCLRLTGEGRFGLWHGGGGLLVGREVVGRRLGRRSRWRRVRAEHLGPNPYERGNQSATEQGASEPTQVLHGPVSASGNGSG